jgi:hypothetical protein
MFKTRFRGKVSQVKAGKVGMPIVSQWTQNN